MTNRTLLAGVMLAVLAFSFSAVADENGAVGGAVAGAVGGAVVGGPIGAVVGGVGGAVVGNEMTNHRARYHHYAASPRRHYYHASQNVGPDAY